jgi:trimeric autotransporter adhesin
MQGISRRKNWLVVAMLATSAGACADQTPTEVASRSGRGPQAATTAVTIVSVTVLPGSATVNFGQYRQLLAIGKDAAGNNITTPPPVTWTSSNPAVASVTSTGIVKGLSSGTVTMTANMGGVIGKSIIKVVAPAPIASAAIIPATLTTTVGQYTQLTAVAMDSLGNPLRGYLPTWSSSNPAVVTVGPSGQIKGVASGTATIFATMEGKVGTSQITVNAVAAAATGSYITMIPSPAATIAVGGYRQFSAYLRDAAGNTLSGTPTWSISDPTVASLSSTGVAKGLKAGIVTVTATINGVRATSELVVTAPWQ